jgi:hypothetical protein
MSGPSSSSHHKRSHHHFPVWFPSFPLRFPSNCETAAINAPPPWPGESAPGTASPSLPSSYKRVASLPNLSTHPRRPPRLFSPAHKHLGPATSLSSSIVPLRSPLRRCPVPGDPKDGFLVPLPCFRAVHVELRPAGAPSQPNTGESTHKAATIQPRCWMDSTAPSSEETHGEPAGSPLTLLLHPRGEPWLLTVAICRSSSELVGSDDCQSTMDQPLG